MRHPTAAAVAWIGLLAGCSGQHPAPAMPTVTALTLDVAKDQIKQAGYTQDVTVDGGGVLGIVREKNWTVCTQEPSAGQPISTTPHLTVARECTHAHAHTDAAATRSPGSAPHSASSSVSSSASSSGPTATAPASPPSTTTRTVQCATSPGDSHCHFGQRAIYRDTTREGDVKLEITVGAPVRFTPSKTAWRDPDKAPQPMSVYFPVTITDDTSSVALQPGDVLTDVRNATQSSGLGGEIVDMSTGTSKTASFDGLKPGQSVTYQDAYGLSSLDGIEYTVKVDGLAGYSITFER